MESLQVQEYMNHYPVTFTPDMAIDEASQRFIKTKQIGGPVIDENKQLVGFLSENDVLAKMIESSYYNEHTLTVASLMSKDVLAVKPYSSIIELGQQMLQAKPKVYPVVSDEGNLLGTICRNDVLYAVDKHVRSSFKEQAS